MKRTICILLAALFAGWHSYGASVLTNAAAIARALADKRNLGETFDFQGQIIERPDDPALAMTMKDDSGFVRIFRAPDPEDHSVPGDRVSVQGRVCTINQDTLMAYATRMTVVAHDTVPPPVDATLDDIYSGKLAYGIVRLHGVVVDVFRDEADARFSFLILSVDGNPIGLPSGKIPYERLSRLIGAEISVVGPCSAYAGHGPRSKLEYEVYIEREEDITVLTPPPADPFDVLGFQGNVHPIIFPKAGDPMRRKLFGRVEAVAAGKNVYVRTPDGKLSSVRLVPSARPPAVGDRIEAVGIAETDFYSLNLSRAIWRPAVSAAEIPPVEPVPQPIHDIFHDPAGNLRFDANRIGQILRVRGTVFDFRRQDDGSGTITLRDGRTPLLVDATSVARALDRVEVGCAVEVTGLCVAKIENWRLQSPFPHIEDMTLILRTPDDVAILARPSWWTPARLQVAVLLLLSILLLFSAYSFILTRLIRHRTEELHRQRQTAEHTEIRRFERTRLAIELHDSIVQMLTGSAMEVETALQIGPANPGAMVSHLSVADKTLQSCRDELRNSIWDLRNDALEEETLEGAILRTLTPHVNKAQIEVRFPVRRNRLSDNTCHAILKVIRELTLNAVNHGHAKSVRISGGTETGDLHFSVVDDGCGFDPANRPGILEGHFGLQGVKERIQTLGGTFTLSSAPGQGTRAQVSMPITPEME